MISYLINLKSITLIFSFVIYFQTYSQSENNFSIDDYMALGIPNPIEDWTVEDYDSTLTILKKLMSDNKLSLPKSESSVFKRIISKETLKSILLLDKNSLNVSKIEPMRKNISGLLRLYGNEPNEYHGEIADLIVHTLYALDLIISFVEHYLSSLEEDTDDGSILQIKKGFGETVNGILDWQAEVEAFNVQDLEKISFTLTFSCIKNRDWLLPEDKKEIMNEFALISKNGQTIVIRKNYRTALEFLN